MKLTRPLAFIDAETHVPGLQPDPAADRIISFAILRVETNGKESSYEWLLNPGCPISPGATKIHGITDEMVRDCPSFKQRASHIMGHINGCDLAGFCCRDYDVPLLWEEFYRAGIKWDLTGVNIIDAGIIFRVKEERTLTAAMKFYCGKDHAGAHGAKADVAASRDVLWHQLVRYPDLGDMNPGSLSAHLDDGRIDLAGKIVKGPDGRPTYAIGKAKGVAVVDDPGFGHWMLKNNFSEQTKQVLRSILR